MNCQVKEIDTLEQKILKIMVSMEIIEINFEIVMEQHRHYDTSNNK
jgi:hypothetical protein